MGIRELLEKNQKPVAIGAAVVVVLCVIWITMQSRATNAARIASQSYYTIDDGKSYFADDAMKVPPYTYEGKEAVRAFVYDCKGTKSVHYMERYNAAGQKAAEESLKKTGGKAIDLPDDLQATEYKRPGETAWRTQPPGPKACADGGQPEWVVP